MKPGSLRKLTKTPGLDLNEASAEKASLKKLLMDKKQEIGMLEGQAAKVHEIRILLRRLIEDFQDNRHFTFVSNLNELVNDDKIDIQELVEIVRSGINKLIDYHEKLAARYELELSKNLFMLNQQVQQKNEELEKERELLRDEEAKSCHKKGIIKTISYDKLALQKTIRMKRAALARHLESGAANQSKMEQTILKLSQNEFKIKIGTIASGDIFCTEPKMKEKIRTKFNADAIEMEGAAIAQVCKLNEIPFIVIRSISDNPNGKNEITFDQFLEKASKRCAEIINKFLN